MSVSSTEILLRTTHKTEIVKHDDRNVLAFVYASNEEAQKTFVQALFFLTNHFNTVENDWLLAESVKYMRVYDTKLVVPFINEDNGDWADCLNAVKSAEKI